MRCVGQAYNEDGQCAFNKLNEYEFKKNRFFQWKRLRRWKKSVELRQKYSPDKHTYFNDLTRSANSLGDNVSGRREKSILFFT